MYARTGLVSRIFLISGSDTFMVDNIIKLTLAASVFFSV